MSLGQQPLKPQYPFAHKYAKHPDDAITFLQLPAETLIGPCQGHAFESDKVEAAAVEEKKANEEVNHPSHYTQGGIECIDAIEAALTPEEFRGYCKGNALKYIWRERMKGKDTSIAKAQWYLNRFMETL